MATHLSLSSFFADGNSSKQRGQTGNNAPEAILVLEECLNISYIAKVGVIIGMLCGCQMETSIKKLKNTE